MRVAVAATRMGASAARPTVAAVRSLHTCRTLALISTSTPSEKRILVSSAIHPSFAGPAPIATAAAACAAPEHDGPPEGAMVPESMVAGYKELLNFAATHPFWNNSIYKHRRELSFDEWKLYFEQDYYDSCSFTRYIGGLMWRCDDDLLRSRLTANLYEEGGGLDESERHAQILRDFLVGTLGTDLDRLDTLRGTRDFVNAYLVNSAHEDPLYCSAFLSLGTEGICSPMFMRLVDGMLHGAASPPFKMKELKYFTIHISCDDAHAGTLAEVMFKYAAEHRAANPSNPDGWIAICKQAADKALTLRGKFFDAVYEEILLRREAEAPVLAKQSRQIKTAPIEQLGELKPAFV